jgi:hypothetical protein
MKLYYLKVAIAFCEWRLAVWNVRRMRLEACLDLDEG